MITKAFPYNVVELITLDNRTLKVYEQRIKHYIKGGINEAVNLVLIDPN